MKRLFWSSLAIKLVLAAFIPIFADEAYYWVWSHHLQLSYFDHPAMVAWLFYLGHFLEPFANCVRYPAVLLGHATLAVWLLIMCEILPNDEYRRGRLFSFMLLVLFSPFLGVGSLIVTPDIPIMFFWSLAIYFLIRLEKYPTKWNYIALGAALGLGFCSKYHAVLFVPALFLYLIFEKRWREIEWRYVPLTVIAGLIFCLPVLIWNYQHDFVSFKFQLHHGFENRHYKISWIWDYILAEIGLLFPLIFWAAVRARPPRPARLLIYFAWFPFLFFLYASTKSRIEANWPIIGFPAVFALAIFYPKIKTFTKYYIVVFGSALVAAIAVMFIPQLRFGHLKNAFQYEELAKDLKPYRPLFTQTHQWAASLNYITKEPIYKLGGIDRIGFYEFIPQSKPSGDHFYLLVRATEKIPPWLAGQHWQQHDVSATLPPQYKLLEFTREIQR